MLHFLLLNMKNKKPPPKLQKMSEKRREREVYILNYYLMSNKRINLFMNRMI